MSDLVVQAQMQRIEPRFQAPRINDQQAIRGIIFVIRNGLRWRDAPAEYGLRKTIYNRFIRWSRLDVFNRIFAALAVKAGKPDWLMIGAMRPKAQPTASSIASATGSRLCRADSGTGGASLPATNHAEHALTDTADGAGRMFRSAEGYIGRAWQEGAGAGGFSSMMLVP